MIANSKQINYGNIGKLKPMDNLGLLNVGKHNLAYLISHVDSHCVQWLARFAFACGIYVLIQVYDDVLQAEWNVSSLHTCRGGHIDKTSLFRPWSTFRSTNVQLVGTVCMSRLEIWSPENTYFARPHQASELDDWPNDATCLFRSDWFCPVIYYLTARWLHTVSL